MSVVVSVEESGTLRKQVTVEVPAEEVEAATRKRVSSYARQVRLPGFRKGKVPGDLVRRRFRSEIDREVVEELVPRYWERAREEQGFQVLGAPQLEEVGELVAGEPLRFVAVVELRPAIAIGELPELELPDPAVEPTDEEVETALDDLRRQVGEWVATERPAARGDQVSIHVVEQKAPGAEAAEGVEGAAAAEAGEGDRLEVEVGDPRVWEELSLAVTGLAAGQKTRFTRRPEEGGGGEPRSFQVTVEAVKERELPPLDDALAKRLGEFADVAELRAAVEHRLRHGKEHERDEKRRDALLAELRGRYPVTLPEGVVRTEVERMANDFAGDLARRGIDPQKAQVDWEKLAADLREPAERRVHERLVLDAIAEHEGLEVSDSEVDAALGSIARAQGTTVERVAEALGGASGVRARLLRDKAMRHLLGDDGPEHGPTDETAGAEAAGGADAGAGAAAPEG